jgi:hypothetical protein
MRTAPARMPCPEHEPQRQENYQAADCFAARLSLEVSATKHDVLINFLWSF